MMNDRTVSLPQLFTVNLREAHFCFGVPQSLTTMVTLVKFGHGEISNVHWTEISRPKNPERSIEK